METFFYTIISARQWIFVFAILAIPLFLNIVMVVHWRGYSRLVALLPLLLLAPAYAWDLYSATQGGNLTGIATIVATPLAAALWVTILIVRAVVSTVNRFRRGATREGVSIEGVDPSIAAPAVGGSDVPDQGDPHNA